jgi:hypothetical protein
MHTLDHVQAEPETEIQEKQAPKVFEGLQVSSVVNTNIAFEQGKPRCISLIILDFLITIIMLCLIVH